MSKKALPVSLQGLRVGLYPYGAAGNPYQRLISTALTAEGFAPVPLPKQNWFALRWASRQPIDLLQMYWPHSLYHGRNFAAATLKRLMFTEGLRCLDRIPFLYTVDNLFPHDSNDEAFEKRMIQRLIDRADGFLVMARASGEVFRQNYNLPSGAEIYPVPISNYINVYPNEINQTESRRRLNLPASARVAVFFGRLSWYKGLDKLIPAFLSLDAPETVLLLAGQPEDPTLVPILQQLTNELGGPRSGQVRVDARFIPDADVQLYLNAADFSVLPFADMPMSPSSVVLSMGFGKPVISPAKAATPEIVGDTLFGYDDRDVNGLANALQRAFAATDLAERGREVYARACANHSRERLGAAFRDAYERLAGRLQAK
jgi:beta-1,4-mannosyltransferase